MPYYLGIDLGTTYTAAATERDGLVEALTLGNRTASVPSVVFLRDDGEILVGEAATRRATSDPGRVAREFKRRVGDPTPLILGGTPYAAEMLMARLLRWSLDRVKEQLGEDPVGIALTHPANWGPYKLDLLRQAVRQVDVDADLMLPEPVAAATFYASQRRLDADAVVAVYDLGGGTFDAAMVRRTTNAFQIIGSPEGIERLGGIDFDEAVFAHVRTAIGDALDMLDPEEPASVAALARLRQECIDAKEALSSDTDTSIPVLLPNLQTEVRLTRSEFEDMIRPAISETIVALRRSIRSAGVSNDDINAVLLVGGSSRIPLVAQMVAAELGRPIAIDAHPKDAISFGAAIAVAQQKGQATPESVKTLLPADNRPPPPTMALGTNRPAPPRPAPPGAPGARPAPPGARPAPPGARPAPPAARPAPPQPGPATRPQPVAGNPAAGATARPAPPQPVQQPPRPAAPAQPHTGQPHIGQPAEQPRPAAQPTQPLQQPAAAARPSAPAPAPRPVPPGASPIQGTPAVQRPSPAHTPAHRPAAHGPIAGGTPSGGYPAQRPAGGGGGFGSDDNRTPLLIAIGVVAVVLFIIILLLVAQGGGDDNNSSGDGNETNSSQNASSDSEEPTAYTEDMRVQFLETCVAGNGQSFCDCAWDKLTESVSFDEFYQYDQDAREATEAGEAAPQVPQAITDAIAPCATEATA